MNMQEQPEEHEAAPRMEESAFLQRMLKSRNILLSGEVNKQLAEKVIRQLILLEEDNSEAIRVFIDSPGGDADAGYAAPRPLSSLPRPKTKGSVCPIPTTSSISP
jgi:ATP-dependent Clp protease protease subunit